MKKQIGLFDTLDNALAWLRTDDQAAQVCAVELGRRGGIASGKVRKAKAVAEGAKLERELFGGKPAFKKTVYHGSRSKHLERFEIRRNNHGKTWGRGVYFTPDQREASGYAKDKKTGARGRVYEVEIELFNPFNPTKAIAAYQRKGMKFNEAVNQAIKDGLQADHDGIIFDGDRYNAPQYVVFDPEQTRILK